MRLFRVLSLFSMFLSPLACGDKDQASETDQNVDAENTDTDTTSPDPLDVDDDGDGQTENQGDCDDSNADTYTGAEDRCDGVDNNCSGDELDCVEFFFHSNGVTILCPRAAGSFVSRDQLP